MRLLKYIILILFLAAQTGCISQEGTLVGEQKTTESTNNVKEGKVDNESDHIQIYASVGGKKISQEELDYECFRAKLQKALANNQEDDTCPPEQTLISQIIELKAIDYLAEEKGVAATEEEVQQRMDALKEDLASSTVFKEMVSAFGEEKYWQFEKQRYFTIINAEKIKEKLAEEEKEKHSYLNDESLKYNAKKKFDDLIVEAVGKIETTIFYH